MENYDLKQFDFLYIFKYNACVKCRSQNRRFLIEKLSVRGLPLTETITT